MNENNGFIVINKKILKWEWYQDTNTVRLFLHLLLIANWEDKRWQGIEVKRGQVITSLKHLVQQTKLTLQQVRTSLTRLISTNEITKTTTNKYTVITINNYNRYQDYNKQNNKQITNEQQTNNKQITTTKQINNITNKQYISTTILEYVEENFGRTLSPVECEEILSWNDNELTRYAIKQAVLLNKISTKYISRILSAYERENVKTVQQAQERERKYNVSKPKKYIEKLPDWFDKDFSKQEATIEEQQEIKELLSKYE
ncbi:MAG: DnaD domain protein [Bacilli bacterium]|nr:DnaD domain protein [Bacilli bacterium]